MRINTDQPSSGRPLQLLVPPATNGGFVPVTWTTIAEAPDFSVPAADPAPGAVDPADTSRELRPGEVFIESPLAATNDTGTTRWVEVAILLQGAGGHQVPLAAPVKVPPGETILLPIQGFRLLKTDFSATDGDRLQIRAEVANAIKVMGTASELEALQHAPDSEV